MLVPLSRHDSTEVAVLTTLIASDTQVGIDRGDAGFGIRGDGRTADRLADAAPRALMSNDVGRFGALIKKDAGSLEHDDIEESDDVARLSAARTALTSNASTCST